jgi:hypothetical protein
VLLLEDPVLTRPKSWPISTVVSIFGKPVLVLLERKLLAMVRWNLGVLNS